MSHTLPHTHRVVDGVEILGHVEDAHREILTPEALRFCAALERQFRKVRAALLTERKRVQKRLDAGHRLDFIEETKPLRESEWRVADIPKDLENRAVELTGPVDRKMIVNALNSGADVFTADFEDSTSPTWANIVDGQVNLHHAVRRTIGYTHPKTGMQCRLAVRTATLMVRPRGWHLDEKHVLVDGKPISASIFDFALFFFHNAKHLVATGTGPYLYLPKLESYAEAGLWNDIFVAAQRALGIAHGTIRATVLIETIHAAFQMEEILYELRHHCAGLSCGPWDYIFSFIKSFRNHRDFVLPDRAQLTMDRGFLRAYCLLLIKTCHRRGAHAVGGMAAHRLGRTLDDVEITAADLLAVPDGEITEAGLRANVDIGLRYLEAWLSGNGCGSLENLMEDAATAEISRTQVWQWLRFGAEINGRKIDKDLVQIVLTEQLKAIEDSVGPERFANGRFGLAAAIFERLITSEEFEDFLTLPAYEHILTIANQQGDQA